MALTHSDQLDILQGMIDDNPAAHTVLDLTVREMMYLVEQNVSKKTITKAAEWELIREGGPGMTAVQILDRYASQYADLNGCAKGEA